MPKLFNLDHSPVVVDYSERAVMPGESYDFTDEQVAAGIAGQWSEEDPRAGLKDEERFKRLRDTSRPDLDAEARELGIEDPEKLPNKEAVLDAIEAAQAAVDGSDDGTSDGSDDPSGDTNTSE